MAEMLSVSGDDIEKAARALREGRLVAFPTETVYGLGADAFNPRALARVFQAKERPRFDPLIVHIASLDDLSRAAALEKLPAPSRRRFDVLAEKFWPGPLTVILPKRDTVPDLATSGLPTVALRFPAHSAARRLIARSTGAVAAPSANRFGRLSPTLAEHVREDLGDRVDFIIDGGPSAVGIESTVLDLSSGEMPRLLRPGGVSIEEIEKLTGPVALPGSGSDTAPSAPLSPGMLQGHYAPRTPLLLHGTEEIAALLPGRGEGFLFFCGRNRDAWASRPGTGGRGSAGLRVLSESGDAAEAAARLFSALHELDALGLAVIHAEAAPESGLGLAINDRLRRAAQKSG